MRSPPRRRMRRGGPPTAVGRSGGAAPRARRESRPSTATPSSRCASAAPSPGGEPVDLVEHEQPLLLLEPERGEDLLDRLDLLRVPRVGGVHDVEQQVGVGELLERRAERVHEVRRQVADEAHRVGDDHLAVAREAQPAARRIERREELVLGEHVRVGERVEERGLAGVGVADDGEHRQAAVVPLLAPELAARAERLDAPLERGDPVAHAAAVDLELRLAGAAPADAAGEARERVVAADEARVEVLELGELDLELAVGATGRAARRCRG